MAKVLDAIVSHDYGWSMQFHVTTAEDIQSAATAAGLSISAMCREAGIDPSTFWRWKSNKHTPHMDNIRRMCEAIERHKSTR